LFIVLSCRIDGHDKLYQAAIRHATTSYAKLRYAMPRQAVPSCDTPRHSHATILDATLRHAMSCHAKLQRASFLLAGRLATMTHHCLSINRKERVECHKLNNAIFIVTPMLTPCHKNSRVRRAATASDAFLLIAMAIYVDSKRLN